MASPRRRLCGPSPGCCRARGTTAEWASSWARTSRLMAASCSGQSPAGRGPAPGRRRPGRSARRPGRPCRGHGCRGRWERRRAGRPGGAWTAPRRRPRAAGPGPPGRSAPGRGSPLLGPSRAIRFSGSRSLTSVRRRLDLRDPAGPGPAAAGRPGPPRRPGAAGRHLGRGGLGAAVGDRVPALDVRGPGAGRQLHGRRRHHQGGGGGGLDGPAPVRRRPDRRAPGPTAGHRLVGHGQRPGSAHRDAAPLGRLDGAGRQRALSLSLSLSHTHTHTPARATSWPPPFPASPSGTWAGCSAAPCGACGCWPWAWPCCGARPPSPRDRPRGRLGARADGLNGRARGFLTSRSVCGRLGPSA